MSKIFNDEEFKKKDFNKQRDILSNYFDKELIDEEFKTKDDSKQQQIKDNFIMKTLSDIGAIKPREDGAGFLTRTKFSFADTDKERTQVLEDEYGKGNAYKYGDRWLVNEGGKKGWNYVDESKLSWKDTTADIAGDIPEVLGGALGGTAGAIGAGGYTFGVGAVPGGTVGVTLGTTAGRSTKDLIKSLWGIDLKDDNSSLVDKTLTKGKRALESGLIGGISDGLANKAGDIGKWGIDKVTKPFADKMTPEAIARRELAQQYGIDLTPAQVTQSSTLGRLENGMKSNFSSADTLKNFIDKRQMIPFSQSIKDITPQNSNDSIGRAIMDSIENTKNDKKNVFNKEYDNLASSIDSPIKMSNLERASDEIINKPFMGENKSPALEDAIRYNNYLKENNSVVDYGRFKNERTKLISDLLADKTLTGSAKTSDTKYLKSSFDNDFNNYAIENGLGDTKKALDSNYADYKTLYDKTDIASALKKENNGRLYDEGVAGIIVKPQEPSRIDLFKKASEDPENIKNLVINKVLDNSRVSDTTNSSFGSSFVPPSRFATQTYDLGEHLSKVGADDIRELGKVAESIKFSDAFTNHSNTGSTELTMKPMDWIKALPSYPISKAYTSDLGRKYLTDGFDVSGSGISKVIANQPVRQSGFYEALKGLEEKYNKQ